jgi:hypothetical protein
MMTQLQAQSQMAAAEGHNLKEMLSLKPKS